MYCVLLKNIAMQFDTKSICTYTYEMKNYFLNLATLLTIHYRLWVLMLWTGTINVVKYWANRMVDYWIDEPLLDRKMPNGIFEILILFTTVPVFSSIVFLSWYPHSWNVFAYV